MTTVAPTTTSGTASNVSLCPNQNLCFNQRVCYLVNGAVRCVCPEGKNIIIEMFLNFESHSYLMYNKKDMEEYYVKIRSAVKAILYVQINRRVKITVFATIFQTQ